MHIVIIGNGIAGNTAAEVARRLDRDARITILSEEDVPAYSPCLLPHYLSRDLDRQRLFLKAPEDYARLGIATILGQRVAEIDLTRKRVVWGKGVATYDKLIIATGSRPIIPAIEGMNKEGLFTLKSLGDADRIARSSGQRAAVVGSGPIGLQASMALHKRGYQVALVELLDWLLPRAFDKEPSEMIRKLIKARGIEVVTGEGITGVWGGPRVEGIATARRQLKCDTVVLALGMRPNAELAQRAGVALGPLGGISTDEHMMTSIEDVYACGDCVETKDMLTGRSALSLLWHNAKQQAQIAAFNCLGIPRAYPGSLNLVGLEVFGTYAVSMGATAAELGAGSDVEVVERRRARYDYRLLMRQGVVLGAQFVGEAWPLGPLISAMQRRDNLGRVRDALTRQPPLPQQWLAREASRYLDA